MKGIIAGLALGASTLVTVAPAQAAPISPVESVKKQLSPGHGVRISMTSRSFTDGKPNVVTRVTGSMAFGRSGVVASDLSVRYTSGKGTKKSDKDLIASLHSSRTIVIGEQAYVRGGLHSEYLPEGKKWLRSPARHAADHYPLIDIFDAELLKKLVAGAKQVNGDYRGTITIRDLAKSRGQKVDDRVAKVKVGYLLDTDSKGLVSRTVSEYTLNYGVLGSSRNHMETRFTGWGAKVKIKAPPESQWIDAKDLADAPQDPANNPIDLLGQNR
ncbi:hypothetical protein ACIBQX_24200 [Nonomuraea sp. NPDC049714]|uniref:hypothetical protein n=1 Tax=Nonomuraea sp. NPDC049714 TaxID=3364357 RepID=UPI003792B3FC